MNAIRALPATTSYAAVPFGVSSPPTNFRSRRAAVIAKAEPSDKSVEIMRKFSEQYARKSGTYFCVDKSVTSVVIKGLADHKDSLGAPLCPCRHYDDKAAEATQGFWNCPCVPMRERKECHCMLFLTPDNDFAGDEQTIVTGIGECAAIFVPGSAIRIAVRSRTGYGLDRESGSKNGELVEGGSAIPTGHGSANLNIGFGDFEALVQ